MNATMIQTGFVAVLVIVYGLFSWSILRIKPMSSRGRHRMVGQAYLPIVVDHKPAPLHTVFHNAYFYGVVCDGDTPQMMQATLEMVPNEAVLAIPVIGVGNRSPGPVNHLVQRGMEAMERATTFDAWCKRRTSESPIFAALAAEMGLGLALGVAA